MTSHTEATFNKYTGQGKGILIGNWAEERSLREFTGVGRTIVREHIPKRHLNFEDPILTDKVFDHTSNRIYGERGHPDLGTETGIIGKGFNPADNLARVGKKQDRMEADILDRVREEFAQKDREQAQSREARMFETTNMSVHKPMDHYQNTVGRKVMKTQDGVPVSINVKDEQLVVEHGTWRRLQRATDDDLGQRVPKGSYKEQVPVTHWTHNLQRKNFYMSANTGPNPFGKSCGMTLPPNETKAVVGFHGNIDWEAEAARTALGKQQHPNKTQYQLN